jgi:hypothetical protein
MMIAVAACGPPAAAPAAPPAKPAEQPMKPAERANAPARSSSELREATRTKIQRLAFEAFPEWSAAHPDRACPDRLAELTEYMPDNDMTDAWGRPLKMMCGSILPPRARGIAVLSMGEDGKEGTDDDIKSWE